jgi:beta-lactamase regulating signal transducer with metallopeptidase domain
MPVLSWVLSNVILALLLALAAWFAQRWLARHAVAHVLWLLVLVKLVTPPLVIVPLGQSPGAFACTLGLCGCDHHSPAQIFVRNALPWILLAAWSAGAGTTAWLTWRRWARFRRLMAHARPAPAEWQSLAARLSSKLSMRGPPEILAVPGRLPPLVVPGRFRARLLLPMDLLGQLNEPQRSALLLHELVHIKRGDHLVRLLELTVRVAYWWLPIAGAIGRQLRACEETTCDAAVVAQAPEARRDYARLLLDVIDFAGSARGQVVPQATAMSAADNLETRLRAILAPTRGTARARLSGVFAVGLASAILPCALHYDLGGGSMPAATSAGHEPAAGATLSPAGGREGEPFKVSGCCSPS